MGKESVACVLLIQTIIFLSIVITWGVFIPLDVGLGASSIAQAQKQFGILLFFSVFSSGWKIGYGLYSWLVLEKKPIAQPLTLSLTAREIRQIQEKKRVAWVYAHMYPGRMNPFAA